MLLSSAVLLMLILIKPMAWADDQSDLKKVQQNLNQVNKTLKSDVSTRQTTFSSLEKIERDIAKRQKRQSQTEQKKTGLSAAMQELGVERDQISAHFKRLRLQLAQLVRASYKMGQQAKIKLLLSQKDPALIARSNRYYDYITTQRSQQLAAMNTASKSLSKANARLLSDQQTLDSLSQTLEKDQRYLRQLKQNRQTTLTKLDQRIATNTDKAKALKAREKGLQKVIERIVAQRKAKQAQAKKIRARQAQSLANKRNKANKKASKAAFASKKGTGNLPMPVNAPLLTRFGDKRPDSGMIWSGVMLSAKAGTSVKAIAAGEVVYSDWLKGYGQMLIVDHGNSLMSLYGHNSELVKSMGDSVQQGEVLARVGNTAGLSKAALYFEIRHNGRPEDPLKWCRT